MIIESLCADDTFAFGKKLGEAAEPGTVYTLVGDLGVGKTVLTQGLAESGADVVAGQRDKRPLPVLGVTPGGYGNCLIFQCGIPRGNIFAGFFSHFRTPQKGRKIVWRLLVVKKKKRI